MSRDQIVGEGSRAAFANAFAKAISGEGPRMVFARMLAREDLRHSDPDRASKIAVSARVKTWANTLRRWETQQSLPRNESHLRKVTIHLNSSAGASRLEELLKAARKEDLRTAGGIGLPFESLDEVVATPAAIPHASIWRDSHSADWLNRQILNLASPSPIVRLSALHFLFLLADEWPSGRQDCIDILCSYYRQIAGIASEFPAVDEEARIFLLEALTQRLTSPGADSWSANFVDLSRCRIKGFDALGLRVGNELSFEQSVFEGICEFDDLVVAPDGVLCLESAVIQGSVQVSISQMQGGQLQLSGCTVKSGATLSTNVSVSPHPDPESSDELAIIANDCVVEGTFWLVFSGNAAYPTLWIDNLSASSYAEVYVRQDAQESTPEVPTVWASGWNVTDHATVEIDVQDLDVYGWRVSADAEVVPEYLKAEELSATSL